MKLNSLFENEKSTIASKSLKDIFYDVTDSERNRTLVDLSKFKTVAPNGAREKNWPGTFFLNNIKGLTSLEGFPEHVEGDVVLKGLSDLKDFSGIGNCKIDGSLDISGFNFENFNDFQNVKSNNFSASHCIFDSLEGFPNVNGGVFFSHCAVKTFKGFKPVKKIIIDGELYSAPDNGIVDIEDLAKYVETETLQVSNKKLKGSLLSFMKIEGLRELIVTFKYEQKDYEKCVNAMKIISDGIKHGKDIFDVQDELIDAGLEEFTK